MRTIDADGNTIEEYNLDKGHLVNSITLKPGTTALDNTVKFAYEDDDYEQVLMYVLDDPRDCINQLKFKLCDTDYVSAKMADKLMSCSSSEEVDEVLSSFNAEYAEVLELRQQWRDEINELEAELASVANE